MSTEAYLWALEIHLTGSQAGTTEVALFGSVEAAEQVAAACDQMGFACRIRYIGDAEGTP